jgi:hypothetical protein
LCNKKQEIQGILIFFGLDLGTLASIEVFMYAIVLHVELTRSLKDNGNENFYWLFQSYLTTKL